LARLAARTANGSFARTGHAVSKRKFDASPVFGNASTDWHTASSHLLAPQPFADTLHHEVAMHPSWKGYLKLSLVSVPVAAISANESSARPTLNQLHETCHSRIRYQKVCPIHGEVPKEEIVSGYEYAKGQYVVLDRGELEDLRGEREKAINIEAIVPPGSVGPLFVTERSYFLLPDGKVAAKPYALLLSCLSEESQEAVGRGVLFGREELVLLRPDRDVITLTALKFDAEVRDPTDLNTPAAPSLKKEEVALTKTLLQSYFRPSLDWSQFEDRYATEFAELIEAKAKGKQVVRAPATESPPVINLMDALKQSLAGKARAPRRKVGPPPRARRKSG
jgi:DNA end-binding protein Ku